MNTTVAIRCARLAFAAALFPGLASCPSDRAQSLRGEDYGESARQALMDGSPPGWPELDLSAGALDAEARRLKRILGADFEVRVSAPFVVCGDISPQHMDRLCAHTVRDCRAALKRDFFTKAEPAHVHRIFLFKDDESYTKNALRLFDDRPGTPYGYYDPAARALIMNISTGGGTLVHEMVHALRKYDFPDMPVWFDEGLASLFEQCTIEDDRIVGLVNWRLGVFAETFRQGGYVPLQRLLSMAVPEFRGPGTSMHYAEARYLCLYLQERGVLRRFYSEFRDRSAEDPTGVKFLAEAAGKTLEDLEKEWLDWVGGLRW